MSDFYKYVPIRKEDCYRDIFHMKSIYVGGFGGWMCVIFPIWCKITHNIPSMGS